MTISKGDWVRRRAGNTSERGFVTGLRAHNALVRWLNKGKAEWASKRSLAAGRQPRILVLEGSLDAELHSTRSERDALATWCAANGARLAFKTIHCLRDLKIIAESIGRERPPFVHLSCHGQNDADGRAHLRFAPLERKEHRVYLDDESVRATFGLFEGSSLLLSACEVGKFSRQMTAFRKGAGLRHVAAFCRPIWDYEAIIFDLALYHCALNLGMTFKTSIETARKALEVLGLRGAPGKGQKLVKVF